MTKKQGGRWRSGVCKWTENNLVFLESTALNRACHILGGGKALPLSQYSEIKMKYIGDKWVKHNELLTSRTFLSKMLISGKDKELYGDMLQGDFLLYEFLHWINNYLLST